MNLTNFLKQTDTITAQCSREQLISLLHEIGRVLPEQYREDFLKRLKAAGGITETEAESARDVKNPLEFDEMYKLVRDNLKKIDSQEVWIEGSLNEEYDEWYDDSGDEYYYQDDSGISDMLTEACEFVHTCMDTEKYKEGYEIGNQLFSMEILCTNDYGDEEFFIGDMVRHELLNCDLMRVGLDTAYCAYHAMPLKKRPDALYGILVNSKKSEITLETIMQYGDEDLPDFRDFLTLWISYLGEKTGCDADRLILEAVGLLDDANTAAQYAEKYVAAHPRLYLDILEQGNYADVHDAISLGMKAMKIMPKKYMIRSGIALKTAESIIEANENLSLLEKCYFIAYESDTTAPNYLRALLNASETEKKREELQRVFMALSEQDNKDSYAMPGSNSIYSERKENKPDNNTLFFLRFLDGQFADVLAKGLDKSEALGWSGTFMKQGIAIYLLYLYEGKWSGKGIIAMADIVKKAMGFSAEEYGKGTYGLSETDGMDLFCELFSKWKAMVQMEPDVRTNAMKKITSLLEKRTEGIMNANRRNYYGECAAYIAALGEVWESLGEMGAKQKLMTSYRDTYSRRSAFRGEMSRYGWIDRKR